MSNYYEPKKRESYYMGDEDDWRVLWPKNPFGSDPFGEVFGKAPKDPAQPKSEYDLGFEAVFGKVPKEPVLDAKGIKVSHYPTSSTTGIEYKKGYQQALEDCIRNGEAWARSMWANDAEHIRPEGSPPSSLHRSMPLPARASQVGGHHYKDKAMQPWDIIDAWELNFYAGNVVKYILRYRHKDGLKDLQKARHYIDKLIEDYADPT